MSDEHDDVSNVDPFAAEPDKLEEEDELDDAIDEDAIDEDDIGTDVDEDESDDWDLDMDEEE